MKTKLLLLTILFTAYSHSTKAQCTTAGFDFGNNTGIAMYNVSGDVSITLNENNTVTLNLGSNFTTASGPDINAYFVASNGATDATLRNSQISNLESIQFGLVGSNTVNQNGTKSFTVPIPDNVNISDYDRIFFYCFQFNQLWDFGDIIPFSSTNCTLLSIEESNLLETIKIYPNPVSDKLEILNNKALTLKISILNVYGKRVLNYNNITLKKQVLDLSVLKSGVYLMQIETENTILTKKLIKR